MIMTEWARSMQALGSCALLGVVLTVGTIAKASGSQVEASGSAPEPTFQTQQVAERPGFDYAALEAAVWAETNRVRANPQGYAQELAASRSHYRGRRYVPPQGFALLTQEGVGAVDDAIRELQQQQPVGSLSRMGSMDKAAQDLVVDQGRTGLTGHVASDGTRVGDRLNRYGTWKVLAGENNNYGAFTGADMVRQLIIDDGVLDRGHRRALFNPNFRVTGIACGAHPQYRVMCSINYAAEYVEK